MNWLGALIGFGIGLSIALVFSGLIWLASVMDDIFPGAGLLVIVCLILIAISTAIGALV